MSKMTLERKNDGLWLHVANWAQQCSFHLGYGLRENGKETLAVQLLRAHLSEQAEWPSEVVERAEHIWMATDGTFTERMRAALQSVRPPVGLVSEQLFVKCGKCNGSCQAMVFVGETGGGFIDPPDQHFELDACPECDGVGFVASRRAPTKD